MARLPISERRKQIAQMVMEQGYISVRDLSDCFQVSTETIRKDLLDLEQKILSTKAMVTLPFRAPIRKIPLI